MRAFLVVLIGALMGCASFEFFDAGKAHRASADGFRNNYPHPEKGGFWRWKWDQIREGLPKRPQGGWRFAIDKPAFAELNPSVTWVGHSTVLLRVGGLSVLTDPHFSERASPVTFAGPKRVVPAVPSLDELPHIDVVVISHNHYDHLDRESVTRLAAQKGGSPRFFVPLGIKRWFENLGLREVEELDWWERRDYRGLEIHFVPVQHWSKRTLADDNLSLWGGWVLRHPELSFFFAGDTGYSPDFADIRQRFGSFDLAAIPIGAYAPRWFMKIMHLDPDEAVQVHRDVNARRSLAIHWGTFENLTDENMDEPPARLAQALRNAGIAPDEFFVLRHGQTRALR